MLVMANEVSMSVGLQVKLARVRRQMKAKELAQKAGIAPTYLSEIENNKAQGLSLEVFARLCRALDTEPNILMEWDQRRHD
ncbi:MAG: hypothetical protein ETSY1_37330 [Candidatus Entotheonella factor]|uniref:HTH cro/C1-type domain-containing protein n=1 Tax=Entotheonella factor TaxID=1429438 RepID=W4L974_ENTF1|nr:MAG: hypothetical protein ETSY1_37330 [Candidatus Entotheonella factor]